MIVGFCRGVQGGEIVERGDYRILQQDNDQVIDPDQFSAAIRPEMTVEMSIVMREEMDEGGAQEHKCPRCQHINQKVFTPSGWVSW